MFIPNYDLKNYPYEDKSLDTGSLNLTNIKIKEPKVLKPMNEIYNFGYQYNLQSNIPFLPDFARD